MEDLKHDARTCPRCSSEFICRANRIQRCDCLNVPLSTFALEYIRERFVDCLCVSCLEELERTLGRTTGR